MTDMINRQDAIEVLKAEYMQDDTGYATDIAYDLAVTDCIAALTTLPAVDEWLDIESAPHNTDLLVKMTHSIGGDEWETIYWVDWHSDKYPWPIFARRIDIPFPPTHYKLILP